MFFSPMPNHQYVGNLSHEKDRNREEDSDLYYDTETQDYFVVDSMEDDNGVNTWGDYSIRKIVDFPEGSEMRKKIDSLIRTHGNQTDTP